MKEEKKLLKNDSASVEAEGASMPVEGAAPAPAVTLSPVQKKIVAFIRATVEAKGYPPSMREIGEAVGLRSTSSTGYQLKQLEVKGLLVTDPHRPRAFRLTGDSTELESSSKRGGCLRCTGGEAGDSNPLVLKVLLDPATRRALLSGDLLIVQQLPEPSENCTTCSGAAVLGQVTAVAQPYAVPRRS